MDVNISNILLGILTILLGGIGYMVLFAKGKEDKDKALKEMAFDMSEQGWAEEEEGEKEKAKAKTPKLSNEALKNAMKAGGGAPPPKVEPRKHDPSLPFQIGDRVILQNLVGAAELNGRHGVIAAPFDKKAQRYPVDLDLLNDKPCAVKEGNLKKEPLLVDNSPPADMPKVASGCLEPHHGKSAGFIMHVLRKSCSQTLRGETNPMKLAMFGWQYWVQKSDDGKEAGVYPSLAKYLTQEIMKGQKKEDLDKQVSADPNNPTDGAYDLVKKAMGSPLAVASWNVRVEGAFWIVGMGPQGTMVIPCNNPRQVYVVAGFQAPLMAVAGGGANKFPRPPKFHLTLLPWFGILIHDTFLTTTTGSNQVELASPQLSQELIRNAQLASVEKRLITGLHQLQMDPPNQQGVPFVPPPKPTAPPQPAPSNKEKEYVEKLSKIKDLIPPPSGLWNFIQPPAGPNGSSLMAVLNAKGEKFAEFECSKVEESKMPEFLLQRIVELCEKREKAERPAAVGVADQKACHRLQFLCHKIPNLRILLLNVKVNPAPTPPGDKGEQGVKKQPAAAE